MEQNPVLPILNKAFSEELYLFLAAIALRARAVANINACCKHQIHPSKIFAIARN
jgi:hypothetical protein